MDRGRPLERQYCSRTAFADSAALSRTSLRGLLGLLLDVVGRGLSLVLDGAHGVGRRALEVLTGLADATSLTVDWAASTTGAAFSLTVSLSSPLLLRGGSSEPSSHPAPRAMSPAARGCRQPGP